MIQLNKLKQKIIIIGSGGHAKVILDILKIRYEIIGFIDPMKKKSEELIDGICNLGDDDTLKEINLNKISFANGIGMMPYRSIRKEIFNKYSKKGAKFPAIKHSSTIISNHVRLADGSQILHGAKIQTGSIIGNNSIINTGAIIEHDVRIGRHCHVAPGAIICGGTSIEDDVFVGAGSVIIQGITIGKNSVISAGSIVKKSVSENTVLK